MRPKKAPKRRLGELLVQRGLARDASHARSLVMAGQVVVDQRRRDKVGELYPDDCHIVVKEGRNPESWVSRGAQKLLGALEGFEGFAEAIHGSLCLDVGASTGGFTDVLLRTGARHVVAVDVGYGQLAWRLRSDERVTVMDRTNIRHVTRDALPYEPDVIVVDASFTDVASMMMTFEALLRAGGWCVVLVKPQFELAHDQVEQGGVVRDDAARWQALRGARDAAVACGLVVHGHMEAPISGAKGNREWLLALRKPTGS